MLSEIDEARQKTRQRLAGAGGCHEQGMRARTPGIDHLELIAARRPAALREPRGELGWEVCQIAPTLSSSC